MLGKGILWLSAVMFIGYGLLSLFSPATPADFAGLEILNGDGFAEVGAMYGGLQTGLGLYCGFAALNREFYRAGLLLLVFGIGALALARLLSLILSPDAVSAYTWGALGYESITTIIALLALKMRERPLPGPQK